MDGLPGTGKSTMIMEEQKYPNDCIITKTRGNLMNLVENANK